MRGIVQRNIVQCNKKITFFRNIPENRVCRAFYVRKADEIHLYSAFATQQLVDLHPSLGHTRSEFPFLVQP